MAQYQASAGVELGGKENILCLEDLCPDLLQQHLDNKDGLTREGCGRVSIMKATGLANCYTLECSYASGYRVNHISSKLNLKTG